MSTRRPAKGPGGLGAEKRLDGVDDLARLGHAARPVFAAGHLPFIGADKGDAVFAQARNVPLGRRVLPHAHVHGWRCQHLLVGGEQHGGGEIVGQAMRHLGEEVCRRRRHHDEIRFARQADVSDLGLVLKIEEIGEDLLLRQHGE